MKQAQVAIIMGSESDMEVMKEAGSILKSLGISHEFRIASAHRSPNFLAAFVKRADARGTKVFIAGAGSAAALPGAVAAMTARPVIGVPLASSSLQGLDSLLSIAQMPSGVAVAAMAIGAAGARNSGIMAAQILAIFDNRLSDKLKKFKKDQERRIAEKNRAGGRSSG